MPLLIVLIWALSLSPNAFAIANTDKGSAAEEYVADDDMMIAESSLSLDDKGATLAKLQPWEDGVLPLEFDKGFTSTQRAQVLDACASWSKVADVRCQVGEYKGRSLKVGNKDGCWALWGMGNHFLVLRRRMNLGKNCFSRLTLRHELGHAFGLIHEHQREDRDSYVEIHKENAKKGFLGINFKINFGEQSAALSTPYDFASIMHYSRRAYSKNGKDTIVPKAPYGHWIDEMGRLEGISDCDAKALAKIYGSPVGQR